MPAVERWPETQVYLADLTRRLDPRRLRHVLSVAGWMDTIADVAQLDRHAARTAALLHDYCRNLDNAAMLAEARRLQVPISGVHEQRPMLLHGPVAAEIARQELGIARDDIHDAIYWHTTGRVGLGLLGQALYLADFSEPLRPYPEAAHARAIFRNDGLGAAVVYCAREKRNFAERKRVIDPEAAAFCAWLEAEHGHAAA